MKKVGVAALAAAMCVGIVPVTAGAEEMTTVTIWSGEAHSEAVMQEVFKNWNETVGKEAGIQIEYTVQGGDSFSQMIDLALQSGTAPDFWSGGSIANLADNGYIMAYDDILSAEQIEQFYEEYSGMLLEKQDTYEGKLYSIPLTSSPYGLIYNKDMFKAAGIVDENGEAKPPRTLEEMREYAKLLTDPDKKQYGIIFPKKWDGWFGFDINSPASSYSGSYTEYNWATDDYDLSHMKPFMQLVLDMIEDGSVYPGMDSIDNDTARAIFAEGSVGMKYGASFDVGVLNDQFPATCEWGAVSYPMVDEEHDYKAYTWYGRSYRVNANSEVPVEKLKVVLELLLSDEYAVEMYKGSVYYPLDSSILVGVEADNPKMGWTDFGLMASDVTGTAGSPATDMDGLRGIQAIFLEDILPGNMSIDEGIALAEENLRLGRERYCEAHPDYDTHQYANPDWTPELKARDYEK